MVDPNLPEKDDASIYLVVASREELLTQRHANSEEWRGALSLEQYFRREEHLMNQELTKDGGITPWCLVYQPNGRGERQVLCGCETIKKRAMFRRSDMVEDVVAHGIGSVFCPPKARGRGYAGRMMTEVGKKMKDWQTHNGSHALFSVLYSDIGKEFYAARGWQPFPSSHVSLPTTPSSAEGLPSVRMLKSADLAELCEIDERLIRSRLSKSKDNSQIAVALVPDSTTLSWHHAREEFVAKELFDRHPEVKGAVAGEKGSRVWCFWTRVWTNPQEDAPNTMHILRLVIEDEGFSDFSPASSEDATERKDSAIAKAIAALFAAAQTEAAQWDMKEVQLWNPGSSALAAAQILDAKATVEHREKESITSLLWYGGGSWEDVEWVCNEKYGWC